MLLHILSSEMHKETLKVPFELPEAFLRENQVVAVLTGGTEAKFLQLVEEGLVDLRKPVFLMVSGHSNSLASTAFNSCAIDSWSTPLSVRVSSPLAITSSIQFSSPSWNGASIDT